VPGFAVPPNDNCPNPSGPDYDFAQGALLFRATGPGSQGRLLVGAGQKSGMFWAFDAATGAPAWATQVAPGGVTGGLQWGSATDGRRIWVAASNAGDTLSKGVPKPWTLKDGTVTTAGGWAALDASSGAVLWTTPHPAGDRSEAPVSSANGIVFGCSKLPPGGMYAMDAATGAVLWTFHSGAFCNAGASIADGMVYWGSGNFMGFGAKKVFAFGL
jgi:polyvinyl alcohol dehydrogenase (cytochrome)